MDWVKGSGCWLLENPQAGVQCIGEWFRDILRFKDLTSHDVPLVGDPGHEDGVPAKWSSVNDK